ncbi:GTP-binding protein [Demequina sp. B12]|uniref:GTP-binding protein n=1 Tax=Demequina sp. B12 TaxID=2992757 RepID=UPI00237ADFEE|nr:GTP-binding protein [Demequina sp. B12]MDE0572862.1 GTP-binding protein [Demequina sp. B12]
MTSSLTISTLATLDPITRATASLGLVLDRTDVVTVTVDIHDDAVTHTLTASTGALSSTTTPLEHACLSCAIREVVLPELVALQEVETWKHAVIVLPPTSEPAPVVRLLDDNLGHQGLLPRAAYGTTIAAFDAETFAADATSDDWLEDRGWSLHEDDDRVVAEAVAPIVTSSDTIALVGDKPLDEHTLALADHLRGDGSRVVPCSLDDLPALALPATAGRTRDCLERANPFTPCRRTPVDRAGVWTVRLTSTHGFHPERLREHVAHLAGSATRVRGHFWVTSRPDSACVWDSAAGQVYVGEHGTWGPRTPRTELIVTGTSDCRDTIADAFSRSLARPGEEPSDDVLADWLGEIDA